MKLLLVSPTNNPLSGYGNITHELCGFLSQIVDMTLLLPRDALRLAGVKYKVEYVLPAYAASLKSPKTVDYLRFRYQSNADIVHSLFEFPYDFVAALVAKHVHRPLIVGAQGSFGVTPSLKWPERYIVRWVYDRAKAIIVPSRFTKDKILMFTRTKTPIFVIHDGVNFRRFQNRAPIVNDYKGKLVFLTVGGLKGRKGQDLVIKALASIKGQLPPFVYLMVGQGSWKEELAALAGDLGLSDRVVFLGEKSGDELVALFKAATIYVHTPKMINWNFEGFGIVYLEASACRKPIIATNSGGVADAVVDQKTGIIVPENDIGSLANAILKLSSDKKLQAKLGNNGWKFAKEHDWEIIGNKYLNLYNSLK